MGKSVLLLWRGEKTTTDKRKSQKSLENSMLALNQ